MLMLLLALLVVVVVVVVVVLLLLRWEEGRKMTQPGRRLEVSRVFC